MEDSRELGSTERERQHEAKHQGRWKVAPAARAPDRQNSDKDEDIHSSQDFWEEIGPKMNMNAALLDLSAAAALKTRFINKDSDSDDGDGRSKMPSEFPGGIAASKPSKGLQQRKSASKPGVKGRDLSIDLKRQAAGQGGAGKPPVKKQATQGQNAAAKHEVMDKKLEQLKLQHQTEIKSAKGAAKRYAVEFFKEKSAELACQFNHENAHIYSRYDDVRAKYLSGEKKLSILVRILARQERIISELKAFTSECLERIFLKVEVLDADAIEEVLQQLPTGA